MVEKIEFTSQECEEYVWFAKQCLHYAKMTKKSSVSVISNGDVIVICKYTPTKAILIVDSVDFYCHPKSEDKLVLEDYYDTDMNTYSLLTIDQGGWLKKTDGTWYPLDARLIYSLVDEDAGTFGLKKTSDNITAKYTGTQTQNYGNIYWYNSDIANSTLSWRGTPSIQFPIDTKYYISGLSQSVNNINTVYSTNIYKSGKIFCQAPGLVLGACYTKDDKKQKYLLSFVQYKDDTKYLFQIYKTKDSGKNWTLINSFNTASKTTTPVFISKSGKIFVYQNKVYSISDALDIVTQTGSITTNSEGYKTVVGRGGYESNYKYHGVSNYWPSLSNKDKIISTKITTNAVFTETGNGGLSPALNTTQVPTYRGNPATTIGITQTDAANVGCSSSSSDKIGFQATLNGAYCSLSWTGVDCHNNQGAVKLIDSKCTAYNFTVTCTALPQGISASLVTTFSPETSLLSVSGDQGELSTSNGAPTRAVSSATYVAHNAVGNVTWTNSSGTIDDYGNATFSGCGSATITATDECGRSASISVAIGTGTWIQDFSFVPQGTTGYCEFFRYYVSGTTMYGGCMSLDTGVDCSTITYCKNDAGISAPVDSAWCDSTYNKCYRWKNVLGRFYWGCATP